MSILSQAPPVYRPQQRGKSGVQLQPAGSFRTETRPAPPAYRPQQAGASVVRASAVFPGSNRPVQTQSQYELSPAVWVGSGRQQIRAKLKGSLTAIGSVDVHYDHPGKAFISDLEVSQSHRRHGVATMLMKAAMDSARRNGSSATELEARPGPGSISNQALVGMYKKLGFRSAGTTRGGSARLEAGTNGFGPSVAQRRVAFPRPPSNITHGSHAVQQTQSRTIQLMESGAEDEEFEKHVVTVKNTEAGSDDAYATMTGTSGDGKTLKSLLNARPDKVHTDRLFRILNSVTDKVGGRNRGSHQFDCAEPHAVANMAGLGVALEHIVITSIKAGSENRTPCENCQQWLEGNSARGYTIRKAMLDSSWRSGYRVGMGRMSGEAMKKSLDLA
jgi:GNAT superfamily N-acetyltransferase